MLSRNRPISPELLEALQKVARSQWQAVPVEHLDALQRGRLIYPSPRGFSLTANGRLRLGPWSYLM